MTKRIIVVAVLLASRLLCLAGPNGPYPFVISGTQIAAAGGITNGQGGVTLGISDSNNFTIQGTAGLVTGPNYGLGTSFNVSLYATNGAPYSGNLSQWSVPGGYSSPIADVYSNGIGYYHNGTGFYPSNNISWMIDLMTLLQTNKGASTNIDLSCCVPGQTVANMFGMPAAYSGDLYFGQPGNVNTILNAAGTNDITTYGGATNVACFGSTNCVYFTYNSINYTNPFYWTPSITNFTDPQYLQVMPPFINTTAHIYPFGTPNSNIVLYVYVQKFAGYQYQFTPPYNLNPANGASTTNNIGPMNYLLTNKVGTVIFMGINNDFSGGLTPYFPSPPWTNFLVQGRFQALSNGLEQLVKYGHKVINCSDPINPSTVAAPQNYIPVSLFAQLERTNPIPGVTFMDMQASNAPNQNVNSDYIDGTHASSVLAGIWAQYFFGGVNLSASLSSTVNYTSFFGGFVGPNGFFTNTTTSRGWFRAQWRLTNSVALTSATCLITNLTTSDFDQNSLLSGLVEVVPYGMTIPMSVGDIILITNVANANLIHTSFVK